jgi:hypothetical protein
MDTSRLPQSRTKPAVPISIPVRTADILAPDGARIGQCDGVEPGYQKDKGDRTVWPPEPMDLDDLTRDSLFSGAARSVCDRVFSVMMLRLWRLVIKPMVVGACPVRCRSSGRNSIVADSFRLAFA